MAQTKGVHVAKKRYQYLIGLEKELELTRVGLAKSIQERDNLRKAYEEVNERGAMIQRQLHADADSIVRRLRNAEASNQQLSQSNGQMNELCKQLALEKDKMSSAMVTMWNRFEECIQRYHKLSGFKG